MRRIVLGCTVAALIALSARTEAMPSGSIRLATLVVPKVTQQLAGELGLASWYGEEFQGNPTASGQAFDMNGLTAAHRSLPLGTKLKVTNLKNHRSLIVTVNDRGPFIAQRFLDVSKAAAFRLGFMASGLAMVRAEVISLPSNPKVN
jgi:rare lipoprotein A